MTHPISMFCQGKVCGPCLRAGVNAPAAHKIGEEFFKDAPGVIRQGLTQYVCCRCFGLMMGPLAQRACGTTFPTMPHLQPVYGILGEKLVASGAVITQPLDHPVFDAIRPQMEALGEPDLPMDAVRLFLKHGGAALDPIRCMRMPPELVRLQEPGEETRISRKERDLRESMAKLSARVANSAISTQGEHDTRQGEDGSGVPAETNLINASAGWYCSVHGLEPSREICSCPRGAGVNYVRFEAVFRTEPTREEIAAIQIAKGYHPAGYGGPSRVKIDELKGHYGAIWYCSDNCE